MRTGDGKTSSGSIQGDVTAHETQFTSARASEINRRQFLAAAAKVDMPEPDMAERVEFSEKATRRGTMLVVRPLVGFDDSLFSKRELRLMDSVATEFRETLAEHMIETTHLENQPWHKIYVEEGRRQHLIFYELEAEDMRDMIDERQAFIEHFREA